MKKNLSYIIGGLITALLLGAAHVLPLYYNDFRQTSITREIRYKKDLKTSLNENEKKQIAAILSQGFYYVDKTDRVFTFRSADQNYLLKFFQFSEPQFSLFVARSFPKNFPIAGYEEKALLDSISTYKETYDAQKTDTKLLYVQSHPVSDLNIKVSLKDRWGYLRTVDLNQVIFVIEKK